MSVFSRFRKHIRCRTFNEVYSCPYGCGSNAEAHVDTADVLQSWHEAMVRYHAECKPVGMCSREELEHALQWRFPANQSS
jgi:hypothetical protein